MKPVSPPRSDIINPCRRHPSAVEETNKSLPQIETVGQFGCFFPVYSPLSCLLKQKPWILRLERLCTEAKVLKGT